MVKPAPKREACFSWSIRSITSFYRSFPAKHKIGNVYIFCTTSNENKLVTNGINVYANLHLSWCFKLKLKWLITVSISFSKVKQYKNANISNFVYYENSNAFKEILWGHVVRGFVGIHVLSWYHTLRTDTFPGGQLVSVFSDRMTQPPTAGVLHGSVANFTAAVIVLVGEHRDRV